MSEDIRKLRTGVISSDLALFVLGIAAIGFIAMAALRVAFYGHFGRFMLDDAFFFVRYANNFLNTGIFAWNVGEGAVHGNTSQFYQALTTVLMYLSDRNMVLSLTIASVLGMVLAIAATIWAAAQFKDGDLHARSRVFAAAIVALLLVCNLHTTELIGIGMETTWAIAAIALTLALSLQFERSGFKIGGVFAVAISIAFVYSVRPDAALIALACPGGLVLFGRSRTRLVGLAVGTLAVAIIGFLLLIYWFYYGDALPLSFGTKTPVLSVLPEAGRVSVLGDAQSFLWHTMKRHPAEFILAAASCVTFHKISPVLRGAVFGAFAFIAYHLVMVVPLMGELGRYYAPILPIIAVLTVRTIESVLVWWQRPGGATAWRKTAVVIGVIFLIIAQIFSTAYELGAVNYRALRSDPALNGKDASAVAAADAFFFFDGKLTKLIAALGDDCSIAATEDGVLSAYASRTRIVDISGLHDKEMARGGFSAERLLLKQRPDVIVIPHQWYGQWVDEMKMHPAMADYFVADRMSPKGPRLAFLRQSACASRVFNTMYDG